MPTTGAGAAKRCTPPMRSGTRRSGRAWRGNSASAPACCGAGSAGSRDRSATCTAGAGATARKRSCGTCPPRATRSARRSRRMRSGWPWHGRRYAKRWSRGRRRNTSRCSSARITTRRTRSCRACATCSRRWSRTTPCASPGSMNSSRSPRPTPRRPRRWRESCAGRIATPGRCRACTGRARRRNAATPARSCGWSVTPSRSPHWPGAAAARTAGRCSRPRGVPCSPASSTTRSAAA